MTYTAKFKPGTADLTVKTTNNDNGQNFIFIVECISRSDGGELFSMKVVLTAETGYEVVVKDLPIGTYKVREVNEWSWRQTSVDEQTVILDTDRDAIFSFAGKTTRSEWLSGFSYNKD